MFRWLLFLSCFAVQGCGTRTVTEAVDYFSFQWTGGTVFSDPNILTTKEIHFDTGRLLGRDVILEGEVAATGKYFTYLVINDTFGRMLIVLTNLEEAEEYLRKQKPKSIKILGTVERGKKGLPFVMAKSLSSAEAAPKL